MLNHLINYILLHTIPRNYLEIKKCSNYYISKKDDKNYKLNFIEFIKNKYYEYTTFYKKLLNGYNYGKELILFSYNYPDDSDTIFIIKHKLYTNNIKVEQLHINYKYDHEVGDSMLFFELSNYKIKNYSIIRNFVIFDNYNPDCLDCYNNKEIPGYKFTEEEKKLGINITNWDKAIDDYSNIKYDNTLKFKDTFKSKNTINCRSVVKDITRKNKQIYPIFLDVKNKIFKIL